MTAYIPNAGKEDNGKEEAGDGYWYSNVGNNLQGLVNNLHIVYEWGTNVNIGSANVSEAGSNN